MAEASSTSTTGLSNAKIKAIADQLIDAVEPVFAEACGNEYGWMPQTQATQLIIAKALNVLSAHGTQTAETLAQVSKLLLRQQKYHQP